jgi:alkyl hydroperoxide reductase subunit AhpF
MFTTRIFSGGYGARSLSPIVENSASPSRLVRYFVKMGFIPYTLWTAGLIHKKHRDVFARTQSTNLQQLYAVGDN